MDKKKPTTIPWCRGSTRRKTSGYESPRSACVCLRLKYLESFIYLAPSSW